MEKEPTEKMGDLSWSSNPSSESTEFRLLYCHGNGRWEGPKVTIRTQTSGHHQGSEEDLEISKSLSLVY